MKLRCIYAARLSRLMHRLRPASKPFDPPGLVQKCSSPGGHFFAESR